MKETLNKKLILFNFAIMETIQGILFLLGAIVFRPYYMLYLFLRRKPIHGSSIGDGFVMLFDLVVCLLHLSFLFGLVVFSLILR